MNIKWTLGEVDVGDRKGVDGGDGAEKGGMLGCRQHLPLKTHVGKNSSRAVRWPLLSTPLHSKTSWSTDHFIDV